MARKAKIERERNNDYKYETRRVRRCKVCGRARGYLRKFALCRICFRKLAHKGEIPGVKKASW